MIVRRRSIEPIRFGDLEICDYTEGEETRSSMATIRVPPGARHGRSWSKRSDKYYLVTEGRLSFSLGGTWHELAKGDFCMVRQGERFDYENRTNAPVAFVLFHTPRFDLESEVFDSV
jgi:mannose-6-phosphate isomerase-like protein (cupin superfamily)